MKKKITKAVYEDVIKLKEKFHASKKALKLAVKAEELAVRVSTLEKEHEHSKGRKSGVDITWAHIVVALGLVLAGMELLLKFNH